MLRKPRLPARVYGALICHVPDILGFITFICKLIKTPLHSHLNHWIIKQAEPPHPTMAQPGEQWAPTRRPTQGHRCVQEAGALKPWPNLRHHLAPKTARAGACRPEKRRDRPCPQRGACRLTVPGHIRHCWGCGIPGPVPDPRPGAPAWGARPAPPASVTALPVRTAQHSPARGWARAQDSAGLRAGATQCPTEGDQAGPPGTDCECCGNRHGCAGGCVQSGHSRPQ